MTKLGRRRRVAYSPWNTGQIGDEATQIFGFHPFPLGCGRKADDRLAVEVFAAQDCHPLLQQRQYFHCSNTVHLVFMIKQQLNKSIRRRDVSLSHAIDSANV